MVALNTKCFDPISPEISLTIEKKLVTNSFPAGILAPKFYTLLGIVRCNHIFYEISLENYV